MHATSPNESHMWLASFATARHRYVYMWLSWMVARESRARTRGDKIKGTHGQNAKPRHQPRSLVALLPRRRRTDGDEPVA